METLGGFPNLPANASRPAKPADYARELIETIGVSNAEMGTSGEELIRRFADLSNETAGEHFAPREVPGCTSRGTGPFR